jgi:cell shape-determining protein MreC
MTDRPTPEQVDAALASVAKLSYNLRNDEKLLAAEVVALRAERDEAKRAFKIGHKTLLAMQARAEAAEADNTRLRDALTQARELIGIDDPLAAEIIERAALEARQ